MMKITEVNWDYWVNAIHTEWAVPCGWWTNLETGGPLERDWSEACMLVITEIAEGVEGIRRNRMDDKLPHRKMIEAEMADVFIRLCDMAGGFGFGMCSKKPDLYQIKDGVSEVGQLAYLVRLVSNLHVCHHDERFAKCKNVMRMLFMFCEKHGYDLMAAVEEKHEFNKVRADHKLENRMKADGKKI